MHRCLAVPVPTFRLRNSLSECYITGRCLPAMTPRVLVMGDEVRTKRTSSDGQSQSTALQVAVYLPDYRAAFASSPFRYPQPSIRLTVDLPFAGSDTGLSCSMEMTQLDSLGAPYTPVVMCAHDDGTSSRRTHYKKSAEHLPLPETYDACKSLHMLTMLSMHPSPTSTSMLADAPLPRGSDATLASGVHGPRVPERFVTWPLRLVGYVRGDERSAPFSRPDIHFHSLRSQRSRFRRQDRTGWLRL
jgi:hypothetical protein